MKKWISAMLILCICLTVMPGAVPAFAAEQRTVYASTQEELEAALQSNTTIILEDKTYTGGINIQGLENVTIQGTGSTRIVCNNEYSDTVVSVFNSNNITLSGLVLRHDVMPNPNCIDFSEGTANGMLMYGFSSGTVVNCDIGGGYIGVTAGGEVNTGKLAMHNCIIRDCAELIMNMHGGNYTFENCIFTGNGHNFSDYWDKTYAFATIAYDSDYSLTFTGCIFTNNKANNFLYVVEGDEYGAAARASYTTDNCTFVENGWSDPF